MDLKKIEVGYLLGDDNCLLQYLTFITELGRMSQQWDRSEISSKQFKEGLVSVLLEWARLLSISGGTKKSFSGILAELQSVQDLR